MHKSRDNNIDLVKFIASLFIIGIHTNLFIELSDFLNFAVVHVIFRLAVPFFAVCSGYYLSKSEGDDLGASIRKMKRQEVKLIKLYLIWSALYLVYSIPTWIKTGWFSLGAFKDYGFAIITSGSHYHLWYLVSLIYALPLFSLCLKHIKNRKVLLAITIALYLVKAISYGYYEWLPNVVKSILGFCYKFSALFDAAFLILPLLLLGYFIRHNSIKSIWFALIGFVLSFYHLAVCLLRLSC